MKKILGFAMLAIVSINVFAGTAENIQACVKNAKAFAGINLDEFSAIYEGNFVSMSTAKWKNVFCEVKLGDVYTLTVNNKEYLYKGFAGRKSYELHEELEAKTEEAIQQLKSRISLLEDRMARANVSLKMANPNHAWLAKYVSEGIEKATGNATPYRQDTGGKPDNSSQAIQNDFGPSQGKSKQQVVAAPTVAQSEIPIPRSTTGDKGRYYLLDTKRSGSLVRALHKRVGVDSIGYTLTETNCSTMQMRELGYNEQSASAIVENPTEWFGLVPGSSKSDLANFVCR